MDNVFTNEERREIAGRARTLHERLAGPNNRPGGEPPIDPDKIIESWKSQFLDEKTFKTRLEYCGATETEVHEAIANTRWPEEKRIPEWVNSLEQLIRYVENNPLESDRTIPEEVPFADVLVVIADYARERVEASIVSDDALAPMYGGLITQLNNLCLRPLYVEFKSFVEAHDPELAHADPESFEERPTEYYEQFVDAVFAFGFRNFCMEYPVLARQLVYVVQNWIEAVDELCNRLRRDRKQLMGRFDIAGGITELEPLADDAHAKGRLPVRVSFETGAVIYKPRDVDGGIAFYTILNRLGSHLSTPDFKPPTYLSRDGYGWMEPIEYADLPTEGAAHEYYERAGAIACVAYVLNLPDCQHENVIASGSHPTIVDCETVFHPHVKPEAKPSPTEIATMASRTVLFTLLSPWTVGSQRHDEDNGRSVSYAGLGSHSGTKLADRGRPGVTAANTDVISVEEKRLEIDLSTNTPSNDLQDYPPGAYTEDLVGGFEETHETIRTLHADGVLFDEIITPELLDGFENRLVFRSTAQYGSILQSTTGRDPLRDGARLTVEFEKLAVPFFSGVIDDDRYWPLYEAERRALRRRDIPRFGSRPDDRRLFHDETQLSVSASLSGYERCRRRLESMDEEDRRRQAWLLEYTFDPEILSADPPSIELVPEEQFEEAAISLFENAVGAAIETPEADRWVSITPTETGIDLYPTDHSLYHGRCGIAMTAAALHTVTGSERYRTRTQTVLKPTIESVETGAIRHESGGLLGVGAVIYTFSAIADLFESDAYRAIAEETTRVVTDEYLTKDTVFDVVEGTAGTILGLLAYYDRYGGEDILDRAIACGDHLLDSRVTAHGQRVWKTLPDKPPLTGFSHGQSGIAYALARLAVVSGKARFEAGAREGLQFESQLYDQSRTNWAKSHKDSSYVDKWCHGRTGIALARLEIGSMLSDDELREIGIRSLGEVANGGLSEVDHVCCGNLGRADALLIGSQRGVCERGAAVELGRAALARRAQNGVLSMTGHSESFGNPTFFHGLSGVAYHFLRLQYPDELPSVLLLE